MAIGGAIGFKTRSYIIQNQEVPLWYVEKILTWVPIDTTKKDKVVKPGISVKKKNYKLQPKLFKENKL